MFLWAFLETVILLAACGATLESTSLVQEEDETKPEASEV